MANAVVHRLMDGRWRVTNAPADWVDDGRDYPDPKGSDRVFEHQVDAVRDYLERVHPSDPSDVIADADSDQDGPDEP
ncbi:MAG: hypothetical protein ABI880_01430 [Acidobacteriota bacterium]